MNKADNFETTKRIDDFELQDCLEFDRPQTYMAGVSGFRRRQTVRGLGLDEAFGSGNENRKTAKIPEYFDEEKNIENTPEKEKADLRQEGSDDSQN